MNAIGIDMSKDTFQACFDEGKGKKFDNTEDGIKGFVSEILKLKFRKNDTRIGVESTGVYHLLLAIRLTDLGWSVYVINPLESHKMIMQGLRTVKTDRLDAEKIRLMTLSKHGYLFCDTKETLILKGLISERLALVEMRQQTKQRLGVNKLKTLALQSSLPSSHQDPLKTLTKNIKELERLMGKYEQSKQELLRSIPGIGQTAAAALVAFVGDVDRFETPEKLVAYIGLDCRVYQSGTSIHGKGYISKRGNTYLRHILFNSAFIARQYDKDLFSYCHKKLSEGKHYFSVMCAIERKLVHIIYAVWKRGTPYESRGKVE